MARKRIPPSRLRDRSVEVPTDSFGDLAFLLIIFFLLATSLMQTRGILANMPAGEKSEQAAEKTPSVVVKEGAIALNDKAVTLAELRRELHRMKLPAREEARRVVLLEAAGRVPYQQYFEVLTTIAREGGVVAMAKEEK
jgi:biopolymer transport protein ExbD